jgi:hypothetical protein
VRELSTHWIPFLKKNGKEATETTDYRCTHASVGLCPLRMHPYASRWDANPLSACAASSTPRLGVRIQYAFTSPALVHGLGSPVISRQFILSLQTSSAVRAHQVQRTDV